MLLGTSILFIFTLKHLRLAEAIFILYSYCGNDVIVCCFTSKQHHNSSACIRDLACNRGPARLLSVQVNQTPACMRGSASIRPALYHNVYIHGPLGDENIFAVLYVSLSSAVGLTNCYETTVFFTFLHLYLQFFY